MLQTDIEMHLVIMSVFCKNALCPDKIASKFMWFTILIAQHYPQCWKHINSVAKRQSPYPLLSLHITYRGIISRTWAFTLNAHFKATYSSAKLILAYS